LSKEVVQQEKSVFIFDEGALANLLTYKRKMEKKDPQRRRRRRKRIEREEKYQTLTLMKQMFLFCMKNSKQEVKKEINFICRRRMIDEEDGR